MRSVFLLFTMSSGVFACSCIGSGPPCQQVWNMSAVFAGTVVAIEEPDLLHRLPPGEGVPSNRSVARRQNPPQPTESPKKVIRFAIKEAWNGVPAGEKEIDVQTGLGGSDCGYGFERGEDYLVYAYRSPQGRLATGICSRTRRLSAAEEDLAYLRSLDKAKEGSEIRVLALDVHDSRRRGLPNALVRLTGPGGTLTASTDGAGTRVFPGLTPGKYTVAVELRGYATIQKMEAFEVQTKGCAEILVAMRVDRRITGNLRTADGKPAVGVTIELVRTRPAQEGDLPFAADSAETGEDGHYELRQMTGGEYYLGVNLAHGPSADNPYTRWFYPGTESAANAIRIRVSEEPGSAEYNMDLPEMQHERRIEGVVVWPDGRPMDSAYLVLEDPRWSWQGSRVSGTSKADGTFTMSAYDGTRYRLHAVSRTTGEALSAKPIPIEPGTDVLRFRVIVSENGDSTHLLNDIGLAQWRSGRGL